MSTILLTTPMGGDAEIVEEGEGEEEGEEWQRLVEECC
jgi:hypothetical protein